MPYVGRRAWMAGLTLWWSLQGIASAANGCKDVTLKFRNSTPDDVRLLRFEYLEATTGRWYVENVFGVSGRQQLGPGKTWDTAHGFERVGGDSGTRFRVTYQRRLGDGSWGSENTTTIGPFTCNDKMTRTLVLGN